MNLQHLYYFQSLAETEHYAKSAELLHTTTSNLNYAISALEQELQAPLFQKVGRNIHLTASGEIFLSYAANALRELEAGKLAVQHALSNAQSDILRVAAFRLHATSSIINDYNQKAASPLELQMNHMKTSAILDALLNRSIDIGFCTYTDDDPKFCSFPVDIQHLVALVPPHHKLSSKSSLTLGDISSYPVIIPHGSDGMHSRISSLFHKLGLPCNIACQVNSINAAANLSSAGKGITITVDFPILSYFDVNIIPIVGLPAPFFLYCAYMKDSAILQQYLPFLTYLKNISQSLPPK